MVDSPLGGTSLNYVGNRTCICRASTGARKERKHADMADLDRQKEIAVVQDRNRLHRAMRNGAWISTVPQRLNGTELSW